jgi:radical SAM protein with 4Fe4S-binding SPASM domain
VRSDVVVRLLSVPGLIPDWIEELRANGNGNLADELERLANCGSHGAAPSRQILLAPTYRCNLTCSYCYAKNFSNGGPAYMSMADLAFALSWAAAQGVDNVLLAGGEPTVYPHFAQLLMLAGEHGLSVRLTSNGLYPATVRQHIAAPAIWELVAHYDQERIGSDPSAALLFEENLLAARARGLSVILRYTLTERSGPPEWRVVMDLARRLEIPQLNYALAFQGSEGANAFFRIRDGMGCDGGRLESLFLGLCDDAAAHGLRLHLSKPFPLCALSPAALRRTLYDGGMRAACAISRDGFTRNLTVNPDLTTFPCNGIAIRGPKIGEFSTLTEVGEHNAAAVKDLMSRPYVEDCRSCALWYRGICRGACLAEHYWMSRRENEGGRIPD